LAVFGHQPRFYLADGKANKCSAWKNANAAKPAPRKPHRLRHTRLARKLETKIYALKNSLLSESMQKKLKCPSIRIPRELQIFA